jgi:hypothetical protein
MKKAIFAASILSILFFGYCLVEAGQFTASEKEQIINRAKALRGLTEDQAVVEKYEGLPLKSGSRIVFALLSMRDELDPVLFKTLYERPDRQYTFDTTHVRLHYDITGNHAVPPQDIMPPGGNGVPDYIDSAAMVLEYVWNYEVDTLGFLQPVPDGSAGGDSRMDIYFSNIGSMGYYGVTYADIRQPDNRTWASFIVLENDYYEFEDFGYRDHPMLALKVTGAHEFFHTIHYSYDAYEEDGNRYWWYEVSAVWMEDVVFDEVNDYIYYLKYFFQYPWLSLETYTVDSNKPAEYMHSYAACVWARFLHERYDRDIIRQIWQICGAVPDYNVLPATETVLNDFGSTFEQAFVEFTAWNYYTGHRADTVNKYSEADLWEWYNPISQQYEDTVRVRYFTREIPTRYGPESPIDTSFSAQDFTPQPLGANYLVFTTYGNYGIPALMGGLRFDFYGGNIRYPATNKWKVTMFGYDPAQDTLAPININPFTWQGTAAFQAWSRYDQIVVIPSVFGTTYHDSSTNFSFEAFYDSSLTGDSPILFNVPFMVEVKAGNCKDIEISAIDPNNDSIFFETDPPVDSIDFMTFSDYDVMPGEDSLALDTTITILQVCPEYDLVDSIYSILVYARDTLGHYDARQINIYIKYFDPEISEQQAEAMIVAYPNPYVYEEGLPITFRYFLPDSIRYYQFPDSIKIDNIGLYIFNTAGEQIFSTENLDDRIIEWLPTGEFVWRWDVTNNSGKQLASGIYFVRLRAGNNTAAGKFAIIR